MHQLHNGNVNGKQLVIMVFFLVLKDQDLIDKTIAHFMCLML
jgi:hypothetical protein